MLEVAAAGSNAARKDCHSYRERDRHRSSIPMVLEHCLVSPKKVSGDNRNREERVWSWGKVVGVTTQ